MSSGGGATHPRHPPGCSGTHTPSKKQNKTQPWKLAPGNTAHSLVSELPRRAPRALPVLSYLLRALYSPPPPPKSVPPPHLICLSNTTIAKCLGEKHPRSWSNTPYVCRFVCKENSTEQTTMSSGTPAARQTVEVGKQGEYTIAIGNSLKRPSDNDGEIFTSVKCASPPPQTN